MPVSATQFFYYCPSDVLRTGSSSAADLDVYLTENGETDQSVADLHDFLLNEAGRASDGIAFASYLAASGTQSLHDLSADIEQSSVSLGLAGQSSNGGFVDLHAHVQLGAQLAERTASPGSVHLLRHLAAGDRVKVQDIGDPLCEVEVTLTSVSSTGVTFATSYFLDDATLLLTSVHVTDVRRLIDVVQFRQFVTFNDTGVNADEETFNPHLYLLLYRAIEPGIACMTASQLYDDYALTPARIGCAADLRRVLDLPEVENLTVTGLLKVTGYGALQLGNAVMRHVTRKQDMIDDPNAVSDSSLMSSAAAKHMIDAIFVAFKYHFESDYVQADVLEVPDALSVSTTAVQAYVPLTAPLITAQTARLSQITTDSLDAGRVSTDVLNASAVSSDDISARRATINDLTVTSIVAVDASCDVILARSAQFTGPVISTASFSATTGEFQRVIASDVSASDVHATGATRTGTLTVQGMTELGDLDARGHVDALSLRVGAALEVRNGLCDITTPLRATDIAALHADVSTLVAGDIKGDLLEVNSVTARGVTARDATFEDASVRRLLGGVTIDGDTVLDSLLVRGDLVAHAMFGSSLLIQDITSTATTTLATLRVTKDADIAKNLTATRIETPDLYVPGQAAMESLAVTGSTWMTSLEVARQTEIAGALTVLGLSTLADVAVTGGLSVSNGLAAYRGTFTQGVSVEWGDVSAPRGSLIAGGNVVAGGFGAFKGNVSSDGTLSSGALEVRGDTTLGGDVAVLGNARCGVLSADGAQLGTVSARGAKFETVGATRVAVTGDIELDGSLFADGDVNAKGGLTTQGALVVLGDATLGQDLSVARDAEIDGALTVSGGTTLGADLQVSGGLTASDCRVQGDTTTVTLDVATDAHFGGSIAVDEELTVSGSLTIGEGLRITGDVSCAAFHVADSSTFGAQVSIADDLRVAGGARIGMDLAVAGSLTVDSVSIAKHLECDTVSCNRVAAAEIDAPSVRTDDLAAGCLQATHTSAAFAAPVSMSALSVNGSTVVTGPAEFSGTIDFGPGDSFFRAAVRAPEVRTQELFVGAIGIGGETQHAEGSPVATEVAILRQQVDTLTSQLQALTELVESLL